MATEGAWPGLGDDRPTVVGGGGPGALVSVVVPCCGQLEWVRQSVPRVLRHSRPPFELLCVEAGSLDGTADYLRGIRDAAPVRVEVVRAAEEADFGPAVDKALAMARGDFIAWLGCDVLVPSGWLQHLTGLAVMDAEVGAVGPVAGVAPEAQRAAVGYRVRRTEDGEWDTSEFDRFAAEHEQREAGKWARVDRLGGFCLLLERQVVDKVGLLERGEEGGAFDAARLGARVRRAGWWLACCRDLIVHHAGTRVVG